MQKIGKFDIIVLFLGVMSFGVGAKMFYFQYLYTFRDIAVYPYHFGNFVVDWIPLVLFGLIVAIVYSSRFLKCIYHSE